MDKKNMKVAVYFRTATVPIESPRRRQSPKNPLPLPLRRQLPLPRQSPPSPRQNLPQHPLPQQSPPGPRHGVQEMLAAVQEGQVGAVMMPSLRHLGRELNAILPVLAEFQKQKVHIHAKDASALSLPLFPKPPSKGKGGDAR